MANAAALESNTTIKSRSDHSTCKGRAQAKVDNSLNVDELGMISVELGSKQAAN
jgi:hypothetical protein